MSSCKPLSFNVLLEAYIEGGFANVNSLFLPFFKSLILLSHLRGNYNPSSRVVLLSSRGVRYQTAIHLSWMGMSESFESLQRKAGIHWLGTDSNFLLKRVGTVVPEHLTSSYWHSSSTWSYTIVRTWSYTSIWLSGRMQSETRRKDSYTGNLLTVLWHKGSPRMTSYFIQYTQPRMNTNIRTRSHQCSGDHVQGSRHHPVSASPTWQKQRKAGGKHGSGPCGQRSKWEK